jgi:ParB-like chromosome segregation protein Spo0J
VKGTDLADEARTGLSHSFVTIETMALDALGLELSRVRCPPPKRVETIRRDLAINGQLTPLVAQSRPKGERPWLLDGFKRLRAARELGWSHLKVGLIEASASTALALMLSLNRRFELSQFEEALVIQELTRNGLTGVEVGALLGRHKSWVSRRLGLLERLSPELQEDMKLGLLEAGMARRLLGLPRGNQVELAAVARKAALGVKQTETLVRLWRAAISAQARKLLLAHPREAIAEAEANATSPPQRPQRAEDPRLSAHGQWVQRTLRAALRTMTALARALGSGLPMEDQMLLKEELDALSRLMAQIRFPPGPNDADAS